VPKVVLKNAGAKMMIHAKSGFCVIEAGATKEVEDDAAALLLRDFPTQFSVEAGGSADPNATTSAGQGSAPPAAGVAPAAATLQVPPPPVAEVVEMADDTASAIMQVSEAMQAAGIVPGEDGVVLTDENNRYAIQPLDPKGSVLEIQIAPGSYKTGDLMKAAIAEALATARARAAAPAPNETSGPNGKRAEATKK